MVSLMGSVVDYLGSKISSNLTWYSFAVSYSKEEITFQWSSIFTEDKKNEEEDRQRKEERSSSSSSLPTPKRLSSDAITMAPLDDGITYPIVREVWPSSDCSSALKNQRGTYTFLFIRTLIMYQCCLRYACTTYLKALANNDPQTPQTFRGWDYKIIVELIKFAKCLINKLATRSNS